MSLFSRRAALLGVGAALALPRVAFAQDISLASLADQVRLKSLREHVHGLSNFPTRWTDHADFGAVEQWVHDAFTTDRATHVKRQPFTMPSGAVRHNIVVGDVSDPREKVLIGAHFDSISEVPGQRAPGANDNASGIAAMLEAHRVLAPLNLDKQIIFMAFSGEEQGLIGSTAAAGIAAREGWAVRLMLNLDMLGHRPAQPGDPMYIEYDQGNEVASNNAAAQAYGFEAARLAAALTTLNTEHTDIWDSDYEPFEARGYPCIGLYDGGAEGAAYHTTGDTPDIVDFERLQQAARLTVAILAQAAGVPA